MKGKIITLSVVFLLSFINNGASAELLTPGESCRYSRYTDNDDIGRFLSRLQALSPDDLGLSVIGESSEREPIYMAHFTRPAANRDDLLKVFIFATQHGDEQSGKEACLSIIRDIAIGPLKPFTDSLTIYIIPLVNPYGSHHDLRVNGQGLDLNRDHVKLEAPELRALHRVFNRIFPEVTLDVHEKGEDYYLENIGLVSNANIPFSLQAYGRENVLPYIAEQLRQKDITFHEYLIRQRADRDDASGARVQVRGSKDVRYLYRFSTTDINDGRNSFGIYNTLSFILEGASSGRLDDLAQRTRNQYEAVCAWLRYCCANQRRVAELVRRERYELDRSSQPVHLRTHYQATDDNAPLKITALIGADDSILGTLRADRKRGEELSWRDIQPLDRKKRKVEQRVISDWRPVVRPTVSRMPAAAYVIPPGHDQVVRTLLDHDIPLYFLDRDEKAAVEMYRIVQMAPSEADYEAPKTIQVILENREMILKKETVVVYAAGRHRNLVPVLLEPESEYGLIRYDSYRLTPQAGDYYAVYRLTDRHGLSPVPYRHFKGFRW